MRTTIDFGVMEVDIEQISTSATLSWQRSPRIGFVFSLGGILDGTVTSDAARDIGPGIIASATATWLPVYEGERRPFVMTSLTLGAASMTASFDNQRSQRWNAVDLRAGALVGKTFADRFVPFVSARLFGGPVFWRLGDEAVTGSDIYHYTVGAGLTFRVPGRLDVFAEALPLGEQSASIGASVAF